MAFRLPSLSDFWPRRTRRAAEAMTRRFDAAAGGRRAHGFGHFGRTQTEVSGAAHTVRSRSRALYANNPHIRNVVDNMVGSMIGAGIVPTGDSEAVAAFISWGDSADADQRTDFYGLQAEITRALIVDGESFVQLLDTEDGVRLRLLPAELIDESMTAELPNGGYVVNGAEFNASGERTAYRVLPARPAVFFETARPAVRIDARDILHIFKPIGVGQVRGISWLAPIVVPANELDAITDALAVGIKISALHAGFLVDQNNTGGAPFEESDMDCVSLEPGVVRRLPAGYDIKFSSPQVARETASFLTYNLRMLAAGLGVPEHLLSGDLTGANYSSLRAGLLPFRQRLEQVQYHVLAPQFLTPVWRRVHTYSMLAGEIEAIPAVEWLPPAWMQVDPAKQAEADASELAAGLTSRAKLVAARGWNVADLDKEIQADRERERELGLSFGPAAKPETTKEPEPVA
jgi:lambda family phage portal protein